MDQFTFICLFIIISLSTLNICTSISMKEERAIPYAEHCNHVVPESPVTRSSSVGNKFLQVYSVYYSGTSRIQDQNGRQFGGLSLRSISFVSHGVRETESVGVLELTGMVTFQGLRNSDFLRNSTSRRLRKIHIRPPKIPSLLGRTSFNLRGFWSSYSGNLCMVGKSKESPINVVLKLHYPNSSTIFTSLVHGSLQSLNPQNDPYYFQSISILGVSVMNYEYTLIYREIENGGFNSYDYLQDSSLSLDSTRSVCSFFRSPGRYELEYLDACNATNCNPLGRNDNRSLPRFMSVNEIKCSSSDGKVRYLLEFSNSSFNGIRLPFDPSLTLVAEGAWDREKKRLALVACRIKSAMNGSLDDCSIRLSFSLPSTLSLRNRSSIVGQLWSNRNDFRRVSFRSTANVKKKLKGLSYQYTVIDRAISSCNRRLDNKRQIGNYPNGYSPDMSFDMTVKDRNGKLAWGYTSPFYVGRKFYKPDGTSSSISDNEKLLNISYEMTFTPPPGFLIKTTFPIQISAEGIYDTKTGFLCLMGCLNALDCEIIVNLQYPPLNSKGGSHVKGTIESTRLNSDTFYFDKLEIVSNSIYESQARDSIWRMDLEITMVLASNTLACVFVVFQLSYAKKNKDSLPRISIVMLIILTLAHMIPLVLNFEALFLENRNRQNVFLDNGKWVEVNEVLVRFITMVAFLLQFRLLQLAWSGRVKDENRKSLWISDLKVFLFFMPLYIGFGLLAWLKKLGQTQSGLVLDGFLLPQIVFNLFSDSSREEAALAISFYVGTTIARLLPHVYDLCRSRVYSAWYSSELFASRGSDYFSTMWDIVITVFGLIFVVVIYLQQRFGGRCVIPRRFRVVSEYVKVSTVSVELS
ncbi:uncharacterized protein LOC124931135 [Impatiens glandulifera]|uniref:uncharacterized protein LOC124931135 n=1 Tax=Impatiens glandulifera TaxID=253017 RepID=UPI001FB18A87|nr:uncharacterized protein LOC124931135 [Impatiens glandulifera]